MAGHTMMNGLVFDTLRVMPAVPKADILSRCEQKRINLRHFSDNSVSLFNYVLSIETFIELSLVLEL